MHNWLICGRSAHVVTPAGGGGVSVNKNKLPGTGFLS